MNGAQRNVKNNRSVDLKLFERTRPSPSLVEALRQLPANVAEYVEARYRLVTGSFARSLRWLRADWVWSRCS